MSINPFGIPADILEKFSRVDLLKPVKEFVEGRRRKELYQQTFLNPVGKTVLEDLAALAGMDRSTFDKDPILMARNAGRQEMVYHILNTLRMDVSSLGDEQHDY